MEQSFFEVIEVDRRMASRLSNIRDLDFNSFHPLQVDGPNVNASRKTIRLCSWWRGKIRKDNKPTLGYVWFIKGPDGKMKEFKSNINSSD